MADCRLVEGVQSCRAFAWVFVPLATVLASCVTYSVSPRTRQLPLPGTTAISCQPIDDCIAKDGWIAVAGVVASQEVAAHVVGRDIEFDYYSLASGVAGVCTELVTPYGLLPATRERAGDTFFPITRSLVGNEPFPVTRSYYEDGLPLTQAAGLLNIFLVPLAIDLLAGAALPVVDVGIAAATTVADVACTTFDVARDAAHLGAAGFAVGADGVLLAGAATVDAGLLLTTAPFTFSAAAIAGIDPATPEILGAPKREMVGLPFGRADAKLALGKAMVDNAPNLQARLDSGQLWLNGAELAGILEKASAAPEVGTSQISLSVKCLDPETSPEVLPLAAEVLVVPVAESIAPQSKNSFLAKVAQSHPDERVKLAASKRLKDGNIQSYSDEVAFLAECKQSKAVIVALASDGVFVRWDPAPGAVGAPKLEATMSVSGELFRNGSIEILIRVENPSDAPAHNLVAYLSSKEVGTIDGRTIVLGDIEPRSNVLRKMKVDVPPSEDSESLDAVIRARFEARRFAPAPCATSVRILPRKGPRLEVQTTMIVNRFYGDKNGDQVLQKDEGAAFVISVENTGDVVATDLSIQLSLPRHSEVDYSPIPQAAGGAVLAMEERGGRPGEWIKLPGSLAPGRTVSTGILIRVGYRADVTSLDTSYIVTEGSKWKVKESGKGGIRIGDSSPEDRIPIQGGCLSIPLGVKAPVFSSAASETRIFELPGGSRHSLVASVGTRWEIKIQGVDGSAEGWVDKVLGKREAALDSAPLTRFEFSVPPKVRVNGEDVPLMFPREGQGFGGQIKIASNRPDADIEIVAQRAVGLDPVRVIRLIRSDSVTLRESSSGTLVAKVSLAPGINGYQAVLGFGQSEARVEIAVHRQMASVVGAFIGVNGYENMGQVRKLEYAEADSRRVIRALEENNGNTRLLAFTEAIRKADLVQRVSAHLSECSEESTAWLMLSGHGLSAAHGFGFPLHGYDGSDNLGPASECIRMADIAQMMQNCRAKRKVLVVDACRSGILSFDAGANLERLFSLAIVASGDDSEAYEYKSLGNGAGMFSYVLEQCLRSPRPADRNANRWVEAAELRDSLETRVRDLVASPPLGERIKPQAIRFFFVDNASKILEY